MPGACVGPGIKQFLRIDAGGRRTGDVADNVGAGAARAQAEILNALDHGDGVLRFDIAHLQVGAGGDVAVAASTSVSAGVEVTRNTLEKALGSVKASDVLGRVTTTRAPIGAMQSVADMDARHIFNLVRDERVQVITFIISYLPPEKAAQVLNMLRPEQRDQVIERLAVLAPAVALGPRPPGPLASGPGAVRPRDGFW